MVPKTRTCCESIHIRFDRPTSFPVKVLAGNTKPVGTEAILPPGEHPHRGVLLFIERGWTPHHQVTASCHQ